MNPARLLSVSIATVLLLHPAVAQADPSPDTPPAVVFSHVNVIAMTGGEAVLADQTVLVQSGKILQLGSSGTVTPPANALQIDGAGKYLIPGLADLHVHLFSSDDLLPYVAHGVTTVLNMDGSPAHLVWRQQVRDGKLIGPAIYTAGPTTDGYPPLNEMFATAENPEIARALIRDTKHAGYDCIKVYGTLRPDVFRGILESAEREKIPVVGHINRQVGALEVLKSRQVLAAHLEDLLFSRFDQPPTDAELLQFADAIASSHITVTPNLNVNPANIAQFKDLDAVLKSPDANLLPPAAYSQWMPANNRNERNDQTTQQIEQMNQVQQILYKLVNLLNARGVRLVMGTDAAPYGFPGLSAHQELAELVEAGFSPYQALLTATRTSGSFLAETFPNASRVGTVAPGYDADLVMLSANPLADIHNLGKIEGVMLKGKWLSASDIAKMLASAQNDWSATKSRLKEIDAALDSGEIARAHRAAEPLHSAATPWIAEWVLMTKARKLQSANLPAALQVARWETQLYPDSFFAHYLLAALLLQDHKLDAALAADRQSLKLEPHNAAALNLAEKIQALQKPLRFAPAGTYEIKLQNDQSGEIQAIVVQIERQQDGQWTGKKSDPASDGSALRSVSLGGDRLWLIIDGPFGPLELRITVNTATLDGYWAGAFGHNGHLSGSKTQ